MISNLSKIRWWMIAVLFAVGPFHAFLITWLRDLAGGSQIWVAAISAWREVIFLGLGITVLIEFFVQKKLPKFDLLDWLVIAYFVLALIWLPLQSDEPGRWLLGVRFDVMPFLLLVLVRHAEWPGREKLLRVALVSAAVVVLFGLAHALALPQNFLQNFGYSDLQGQYEQGIAISGCQYLEHTDRICRATSTFGGPTRYGTYLLLILGLLLPYLMLNGRWKMENVERRKDEAGKSWKSKWQKWLAPTFFVLIIASIVLTFSRSIWLGTIAVGLFAYFRLVPRRVRFKIIVGAIAVFVVGLFAWQISTIFTRGAGEFPPKFITTIFVRNASSSEHFYLARAGVRTAIKHPLGLGLGVSGPATLRFRKSLTENWFVQIAVEMGVPGLLVFLAILFVMSKKLLRGTRKWNQLKDPRGGLLRLGLFACLLGISVAGLFTHSFEETSVVMMLMVFTGMVLPSEGVA